jgi:hypothetical protein
MSGHPTPEFDVFVRERRAAGELLGASVDEADETVTLFVPEGEPLAGLPSRLDGMRVDVVPLPRARAFRCAL